MKNIIARIFGRASKTAFDSSEKLDKVELAQSLTLKHSPEEENLHNESLRRAFLLAVQNSPYIKASGQEGVLAYLMHEEKDLLAGGTPLSADEKKSLGYSSRLKITREGIEVLTQKAVDERLTPTQVISEIYAAVTRKHAHLSQMSSMQSAGIKRYSVVIVKTGQECPWCKSMDGVELDITQDFQAISEGNCTNSPTCIFALKPILDWDD